MRHVCVIAYVPRIYSCMYADCVIRRLYAICTRIKIIYMCNNYAHVQPLCTCATIMYAYKNYVCVQQFCMRTTIMYSYNNVCVLRVKSSTLDHVRAQTYPRAYMVSHAYMVSIVSQNALPPPEKSWNDVPGARARVDQNEVGDWLFLDVHVAREKNRR